MNRWAIPLAVAAISLAGRHPVRADDDSAARWLSLYGWIQTADQLAKADQWPLALGSYLEAHRLIVALAESDPAFEPEMVAYRRDALTKTIAECEARLTTDEHEVMMKYLDFIESLEVGEAQRYADDYEAAFGTLGMAKALLDEIVAVKPEGFRAAVASQYARLESGLAWLESQIDFQAANRPGIPLDETIDWGTTRFVKEGDLPAPGAGPIASGLFPAAPIPADPADPSGLPDPGPRRFRMSSRQEPPPGTVPPPSGD